MDVNSAKPADSTLETKFQQEYGKTGAGLSVPIDSFSQNDPIAPPKPDYLPFAFELTQSEQNKPVSLKIVNVPLETTHFKTPKLQGNILKLVSSALNMMNRGAIEKKAVDLLLNDISTGMFKWDKTTIGLSEPQKDREYILSLISHLIEKKAPLYTKDGSEAQTKDLLEFIKTTRLINIIYESPDDKTQKIQLENLGDLELLGSIYNHQSAYKLPLLDIFKELTSSGITFRDFGSEKRLSLFEICKVMQPAKGGSKNESIGKDPVYAEIIENQKTIIENEDDLKILSYLYCSKNKADISGYKENEKTILKALELCNKKGLRFVDYFNKPISLYDVFKNLVEKGKEKEVFADNEDSESKTSIKIAKDLCKYIDNVLYPTKEELLESYGLGKERITEGDDLPERLAVEIHGITQNPANKMKPRELTEIAKGCLGLLGDATANNLKDFNSGVLTLFENLVTIEDKELRGEIFTEIRGLTKDGIPLNTINAVYFTEPPNNFLAETEEKEYRETAFKELAGLVKSNVPNNVILAILENLTAIEDKGLRGEIFTEISGLVKNEISIDIVNDFYFKESILSNFLAERQNREARSEIFKKIYGLVNNGISFAEITAVILGEPQKISTEHYIRGTACSPDGKNVASCGADGYVRIYNVRTKEKQFEKKISDHYLRSVGFSPDGKNIAAVDDDGHILVNNINNKEKWIDVMIQSGYRWSFDFSPDSKTIITKGQANGFYEYDIKTKEILSYHNNCRNCSEPTAIKFSPNGQNIATGGFNDDLHLYDAKTKKSLWDAPKCNNINQINSISWSQNNKYIAVGTENGTVYIYDITTKEKVFEEKTSGSSINSVILSPQGNSIVACGNDGYIRSYDVKTKKKIFEKQISYSPIKSVNWSPGGESIIAGGEDGNLYIFNLVNTPEEIMQKIQSLRKDR